MQRLHRIDHLLRLARGRRVGGGARGDREQRQVIGERPRGLAAVLGFEFRRVRSRMGAWRPRYAPKLKKRTALMRELKAVFRRYRSQPIERVINLINPVLRGWVNYYRHTNASDAFRRLQRFINTRFRRYLNYRSKGRGFGWKKYPNAALYALGMIYVGSGVIRYE